MGKFKAIITFVSFLLFPHIFYFTLTTSHFLPPFSPSLPFHLFFFFKYNYIYFFLILINFNWRISTLQYCDGSLPYINTNWPQVCMHLPHAEPPSHLPPHHIPLCCPRVSALGALLHASNLHWSFNLHMVIYMFQCYFSQIIPPLAYPTESKSLFFTSVSSLLPCM